MAGMKVVANQGGGQDPGYEWSVLTLNVAHDEAAKMLTADQYDHEADLVKQLARHADPTHSSTLSVCAVEDFYELRDKGGVLGNMNVRTFFCLDRKAKARAIIVLGVIKKQNDGPTPLGDKIRMRYRKRKYEEGVYGMATAMVKQREKE